MKKKKDERIKCPLCERFKIRKKCFNCGLEIIDISDELQPITAELLRSLSADDRHNAIQKHHEWLEKVRQEDREVVNKEKKRLYRFQNQERIKVLRKRWYDGNKEKAKENDRKRREKIKQDPVLLQRYREQQKKWREDNKEKLKEYWSNPEMKKKQRERSKKRYHKLKNDPEFIKKKREQGKIYYQKNKEKVLERVKKRKAKNG